MKKSLFAVCAGLILLTSCSTDIGVTDIVVESDVGEVVTVKESSVTSYAFNKENAGNMEKEWLKNWKEGFKKCVANLYLSREFCEGSWGDEIEKSQDNLEIIPTMPDIKLVRYRTVDTDVNGDKTASDYKYVACIPEGSVDNQLKWFNLIRKIDGVHGEPEKEIESNLDNDGTVGSSIKNKVCEKYGKT